MDSRSSGLALVSVLLLLSAMLVMAVAMQLLALLGALTTRNQLNHAVAEAELHSRLTQTLILLETQLGAGDELPSVAYVPDGTSYQRLGPAHARVTVASSQPPLLAREVIVELAGARLLVVQTR